MAKRKCCLVASEREKECYNHAWTYTGRTPGSGSEQCMYCGLRRRVYIPDELKWRGGNDEPTNRCPTCNRIRCRPDPRMGGEPVTDPIPEWGCLEIWCGYELDGWRPRWQHGGLT